jgi:hypothetical protein
MLAILRELTAANGQARPEDLYVSLRQYFPEITDADLVSTHASGEAKWPNTVRWTRQQLVDRGFIDATVHGTWAITASGTEWMNRHWEGVAADYSQLKLPPALSVKPGAAGIAQPEPSAVDQPKEPESDGWLAPRLVPQTLDVSTGNADVLQVRQAPVRHRVARAEPQLPSPEPASPEEPTLEESRQPPPRLEPTEALIQRLQVSQRLSGQSGQFELDLAEAFEALGFSCTHLGGSGATDILVTAPLVHAGYTVVVDAKTSQVGRVNQGRIDFAVIGNHRKVHRADYSAVVGEDFSDGNLRRFAEHYEVTLITTAQLAELLRLHASTPFTLIELRELFAVPGPADAGIAAIREFHRQHRRRWRLLADVIDVVTNTVAYPPDVRAILILMSQPRKGKGEAARDLPTPKDVTDAVAFLSSTALAVLAEVPDSGGAYQLTMRADTARRRLLALGHAVAEGTAGTARQLPLTEAGRTKRQGL